MPGCAMYGCKNYSRKTKGTDIKYYSFPKDEYLAQQWTNACYRQDDINVKHAYICSVHFDQSSFVKILKYELLNYAPKNNRNLKPDAVPLCASVTLTDGEAKLQNERNGKRKNKVIKNIKNRKLKDMVETPCLEIEGISKETCFADAWPNHDFKRSPSPSSLDQPNASVSHSRVCAEINHNLNCGETWPILEAECEISSTELWPKICHKLELPANPSQDDEFRNIKVGEDSNCIKLEPECDESTTEIWPQVDAEHEPRPSPAQESSITNIHCSEDQNVYDCSIMSPKLEPEYEISDTEVWPKPNIKHEPNPDFSQNKSVENTCRNSSDGLEVLKNRVLALEIKQNHLMKLNEDLMEEKNNAICELNRVKDMVPQTMNKILGSCFRIRTSSKPDTLKFGVLRHYMCGYGL